LPFMGRLDILESPASAQVWISHTLWQTFFDSDADVLGKQVLLGSSSFEIAGVMAAGVEFPTGTDVWVVFDTHQFISDSSESSFLRVIGQVHHCATLKAAQKEVARVQKGLILAGISRASLRLTLFPLTLYNADEQFITLI
ncbi:MAG: hypothetical protein SFY81_06005, partial [Verrucomicrobiota bacterium]|nr:hypothetical protein [Verrucomicrobiota bacterium]